MIQLERDCVGVPWDADVPSPPFNAGKGPLGGDLWVHSIHKRREDLDPIELKAGTWVQVISKGSKMFSVRTEDCSSSLYYEVERGDVDPVDLNHPAALDAARDVEGAGARIRAACVLGGLRESLAKAKEAYEWLKPGVKLNGYMELGSVRKELSTAVIPVVAALEVGIREVEELAAPPDGGGGE